MLIQPAEFIIIGGSAYRQHVDWHDAHRAQGHGRPDYGVMGAGLTKDDFADLLQMLFRCSARFRQAA